MMKQQKLTRESVNEIRSILEGIKDGKLKHNQRDFFCSTGYCVAGWKIAFDYKAKTGHNGRDRSLFKFAQKKAPPTCSWDEPPPPWRYARAAWGLTDEEACSLFDIYVTLGDQFKALKRIEKRLARIEAKQKLTTDH